MVPLCRLELLSRPRVFTVLDFNQVHMPLVHVQLVGLPHAVGCCGPQFGVVSAAEKGKGKRKSYAGGKRSFWVRTLQRPPHRHEGSIPGPPLSRQDLWRLPGRHRLLNHAESSIPCISGTPGRGVTGSNQYSIRTAGGIWRYLK
eukprot:1140873-Pelagomonas_calceolata.AAC.1